MLLEVAMKLGASRARITSTVRSTAQQKILYDNYKAGKSRFPAAAPGTSKHERGLAVDLDVQPEAVLTKLGQWYQKQGGVWGGSFKDPIHFELPPSEE